MQELTYRDQTQTYDDGIKRIEERMQASAAQKPKLTPLKFKVRENFQMQCVELVINDRSIILTITGANDLSDRLRQAVVHLRDGGQRRRKRGLKGNRAREVRA